MIYELALIAVVVAGAYWGLYFARLPQMRTYALMLCGSALLCGLALLGRHYEIDGLGIAGAVGVGTGACLLVIGPMARTAARRAAVAERFDLARRLLDLAEVLAPGSGVDEEKDLLAALRELQGGNIDRTIDTLAAQKERVPAEARRGIDERIAMLYLTAFRWNDAIAHAEAHLMDDLPVEATPAPGSLRRALGLAPPVYVELLAAYGYTGDLDRAAAMLSRLEEVCAGREDASFWVHSGRTRFLALAGRLDAVQTLVAPRRSRHMSPALRTYWIGVAHERRGERAEASAAYVRARSRSRGRPRMMIDRAIARLEAEKPAPSHGVELGPEATKVVERVESAPPPAVVTVPRPQGTVATKLFVAAIVGYAAAIAYWVGDSSDIGVSLRSGAMAHGLFVAGEWWRGVTCIFVHVGGVHLLVNAVGLWFIGRLGEELFGGWRTGAILALSGLGGAAASFFASPSDMSAGASGAIFGLLGATFIEVTRQRRRHRSVWGGGVWGSLAVVVVAQLGIDFVEPMTDQWAHAGGLVSGALFGFLLSPNGRLPRVGLHFARVVSVAFVALSATAFVMVSRTSVADSLARDWQVANIACDHIDENDPDVAAEKEAFGGLKQEGDTVDKHPIPIVNLPPGWRGRELAFVRIDALENEEHYRVVYVESRAGYLLRLQVPDSIARAAPAFFTQLLASR